MTISRADFFDIDIYGRRGGGGRGGGGRGGGGGGRSRGRSGPGASAVSSLRSGSGRGGQSGRAGGMMAQLTGQDTGYELPTGVVAPGDFEAMIEQIAQDVAGEGLAQSAAFKGVYDDYEGEEGYEDDEEYGLLLGSEAFSTDLDIEPGPLSRAEIASGDVYGAAGDCDCPRYGDDDGWADGNRRPGTFGESLKIGAGLGVGFLGVALAAGLLARSLN